MRVRSSERAEEENTMYSSAEASVSFVPPVSGMMMAGYAVRKLLEGHMPKQG